MKRLKRKADLNKTYNEFNKWALVQDIQNLVNEITNQPLEELIEGRGVEHNQNHIDVLSNLPNGENIIKELQEFNQVVNSLHYTYRSIFQQKNKLNKELNDALTYLDEK